MFILIISIVAGIIFGTFFKEKRFVKNNTQIFIQIIVYLLLLSMGYKMAIKKEIFIQQKALFFESLFSSFLLFFIFLIYSLMKKYIYNSIVKKSKFYKKKNQYNNNENISEKNSIFDDKNIINKVKESDTKKNESFIKSEIFAVLINIMFILFGFILNIVLLNFFRVNFINEKIIDNIAEKILFALLFFIGIDLGINFFKLKSQKLKIDHLFLPFESILITFFSSFIFSFIFSKKIIESMLIYGGLGWYSLSSVLISVKGFSVIAILSFIHNVVRELIAIISAPIVSKLDPKLPILLGGATSMDVMLPFVQKYCGYYYTLASFFTGAICSISVSFIINSLLGLMR